jgi:hypothetical protein
MTLFSDGFQHSVDIMYCQGFKAVFRWAGGCRMVSVTDPHGRILVFLDRSRYFYFQVAPRLYYEVEWTPFQTHYFSENLAAPEIEHIPVDL